MTDRLPRGSRLAIAITFVMAALCSATGSVPAHEAHGHPARIHEGSCEELGAVAFRLNGVGGSVDLDNAPVPTPTAVNPDSAYQVMISETTIDATLEDVLAAAHAVMIYESDEAMDAIACGNIGGALHGGTLITGLAEVGIPGHIGFALFQPDGERTSVSVIFGHGLAPISASGTSNGHDHAEGDEAEHPDEEEDAHAAATPEE